MEALRAQDDEHFLLATKKTIPGRQKKLTQKKLRRKPQLNCVLFINPVIRGNPWSAILRF